jgi:hypothetical protein
MHIQLITATTRTSQKNVLGLNWKATIILQQLRTTTTTTVDANRTNGFCCHCKLCHASTQSEVFNAQVVDQILLLIVVVMLLTPRQDLFREMLQKNKHLSMVCTSKILV